MNKSEKMEFCSSDLMLLSTIAMGGSVAWIMGGNFLQGAMLGFSISLMNHKVHERKLYDRQIKKIYDAYLKTSWSERNGYWDFVPANELCESIGGELKNIKDAIENSCVIRLSAALNAAGYDIPNIYGTMKGEDGKGYFLRAVDLNKYLSSKSSPVKLTYITFNPNNVKNGLIYVYPGKEWQLQGITGHVDVVFRKIWASHVYDKNYSGGNPYGYRYKSNVFH